MKEELENQIFKAFPKLFPLGRNVDPMNSLIFFGLEINDGWYDLIYNLSKQIDEIRKRDKIDVVVVQVKEKFGSLRYYTYGGNKKIWDLVSNSEKRSSEICEDCGKKGHMRGTSWYKTLCDDCYAKWDRKN